MDELELVHRQLVFTEFNRMGIFLQKKCEIFEVHKPTNRIRENTALERESCRLHMLYEVFLPVGDGVVIAHMIKEVGQSRVGNGVQSGGKGRE